MSTNHLTVCIFDEGPNHVEKLAAFRADFQKQWGDLLDENGQWWGEEVGRRKRLFWIVFWKDASAPAPFIATDEHGQLSERLSTAVAPVRLLLENTAAYQVPEVLNSPAVIPVYYRMPENHVPQEVTQVAIDMDNIAKDVEGFRGVAYTFANEGRYHVHWGGWDRVEDSDNLGKDGRHEGEIARATEQMEMADEVTLCPYVFCKHS